MEILMIDYDSPSLQRAKEDIKQIGEVKETSSWDITLSPEKTKNCFGLFIPAFLVDCMVAILYIFDKDLMIFTENQNGDLKCLGKIADLVVG